MVFPHVSLISFYRQFNVLGLGQRLTFVERKPLLASTTNVKTSKQVIIDEARSPRINSWVVHECIYDASTASSASLYPFLNKSFIVDSENSAALPKIVLPSSFLSTYTTFAMSNLPSIRSL
jgi:hypothetical protein